MVRHISVQERFVLTFAKNDIILMEIFMKFWLGHMSDQIVWRKVFKITDDALLIFHVFQQ